MSQLVRTANIPTEAEKAALAGTSGTAPSGTNKLVDNADTRLHASGSDNQDLTGLVHTNRTALDAVSGTNTGDSATPAETGATIAAIVHAATDKATPVDADQIIISDSAATYGAKSVLWSSIKTTLATWANGLYAVLLGKAGGQALNGGTAASENLTLSSTAHATKGSVIIGASIYDHVRNWLGIGGTPTSLLTVIQGTAGVGTVTITGGTTCTGTGTKFLNTFKVGDSIIITATSQTRAIGAIASDTAMTIASATNTVGSAFTLAGGTRVSVLGNGNVGIGTTNPGYLLEVGKNQNAETSFAVINTTDGTGASAMSRYFGAGGRSSVFGEVAPSNTGVLQTFAGNFIIEPNASGTGHGIDISIPDTGGLRVFTGGRALSNVKMVVLNNGNVGIGITAPTSRLHAVDTVNAGSAALAAPVLELAQTWNTSGTPTGIRLTITDTASNAASLLLDLKVATVSKCSISKTGETTGPKFKLTVDGGYAILLTNKTGGNSVKGEVVTVYAASAIDNAVAKIVVDVPTPVGVFYESGIADGAEAWVVVSGIADVYYVGNTTRGHLARGFITGDSGYVTGQALSEAAPTSPFGTDKHFYEIGHVLASRTGAGLAKTVLHFN